MIHSHKAKQPAATTTAAIAAKIAPSLSLRTPHRGRFTILTKGDFRLLNYRDEAIKGRFSTHRQNPLLP
jgi:hypothetical protein